jgi:hypothetical protein
LRKKVWSIKSFLIIILVNFVVKKLIHVGSLEGFEMLLEIGSKSKNVNKSKGKSSIIAFQADELFSPVKESYKL